MKHLFPLLLLLTSTAHAATLGVHIGSHHFPQKSQNNRNEGIYFRADNGFTACLYHNSIRRESFYLGYSLEQGPFGVTVGGVSGYKRKNGTGFSRGAVTPLLAFSVAGPQYFGVRPRLALVPGHLVKTSSVLNLMAETSF
jgi:hypothetical protein